MLGFGVADSLSGIVFATPQPNLRLSEAKCLLTFISDLVYNYSCKSDFKDD
jgi:hypothetical protein